MNILAAYRELICSPAQLAQCRQAASVEQLLQQLKSLWRQEALTDDQLLSELAACNQQIHDVEIAALSGHWLPYRYHAKSRSIDWCLPQGHATEPFHDQYIERCRGQLLNQLITPKTSLEPLMDGQIITTPLQPAGFIFHLSRCGSTLASGCLAELDNTCVLSESPLLTELMLDDSLNEKIKQHLLPQLIHLQAITSPGRHKIIIKWNAWDLFFWSLIRECYPDVPLVLLMREPIEILASHQRLAGRHMAGEQSLMRHHPALQITATETLMQYRIKVLRSLLDMMGCVTAEHGVLLVDYAVLDGEKMVAIARHFQIPVSEIEFARIQQRMGLNAKFPEQRFISDSLKKRHEFSIQERNKIDDALKNSYLALLDVMGTQFEEASPC